jgi:hypothetical protein
VWWNFDSVVLSPIVKVRLLLWIDFGTTVVVVFVVVVFCNFGDLGILFITDTAGDFGDLGDFGILGILFVTDTAGSSTASLASTIFS